MAAMIWDEQAQAFVKADVPMKYDPTAGAWTDTTGLAWDPDAEAWTERWGTKVSAYVYGAASETITIRKNGIIVETVQTDSSGKSTEQITLSSGTYTLTGSVSGWTEEQTVNSSTTKFRAMPDGAIYWYGNECCGIETISASKFADYICGTTSGSYNWHVGCFSKESIDLSKYSKLCMIVKTNSSNLNYWGNIYLVYNSGGVNYENFSAKLKCSESATYIVKKMDLSDCSFGKINSEAGCTIQIGAATQVFFQAIWFE